MEQCPVLPNPESRRTYTIATVNTNTTTTDTTDSDATESIAHSLPLLAARLAEYATEESPYPEPDNESESIPGEVNEEGIFGPPNSFATDIEAQNDVEEGVENEDEDYDNGDRYDPDTIILDILCDKGMVIISSTKQNMKQRKLLKLEKILLLSMVLKDTKV